MPPLSGILTGGFPRTEAGRPRRGGGSSLRTDEQFYEIREGVRRAKAAQRCGHETIAAEIAGREGIVRVPVASPFSPKAVIQDDGPRGGDWGVISRKSRRGEEPPPLVVAPGTRGTPPADVEVEEDEFGVFDSVIRAMHRLITGTRSLAHLNTDPLEPGEDRISLFRQRLQDIEDTLDGFGGLVLSFDRDMSRSAGEAEKDVPSPSRELAAANA